MSLKKKILTDIGFLSVLSGVNQLRGLIVVPILTQNLSIDAYGAYTQLIGVVGLFSMLFGMNINSAYVKYSQDESLNSGELYYTSLSFLILMGSIVCIVVIFTAELISLYTLGTKKYGSIFQLGALIIPFRMQAKLATSQYWSQMRTKLQSLISSVRSYLIIISMIILVMVFNEGLNTVVLAVVIVEIGYAILLQAATISHVGYTKPTFSNLYMLLKYSIPLTISVFATQITSRADRIIVGYFLGAGMVGIYSISYGIADVISSIVQPIRTSFFPEFSRIIEEGETGKASEYVSTGVHYFLALAIPAAVGLYFVGPELIYIISTSDAATKSHILLPILSFGIIFWNLDILYGVIQVSAGDTLPIAASRFLSAIINIILNMILIPLIGITGAAIATFISYLISSLIVGYLSVTKFRIKMGVLDKIKIIVASAIMGAVLWTPTVNELITAELKLIPMPIIIGIVTYSVFLLLIGGIDRNEVWEILVG